MANKISKSTAYIIDVLCEGPIEGPANSVSGTPSWKASSYFNETVVTDSAGEDNFDGVSVIGREGLHTDANYLSDFNTGDMLQAETIVNVEMTYAGGATTRSITDDEVDHCAITFSFPQGLMVAYDSGKQNGLSVSIKITMTPTDGEETTIYEDTISKEARSEFRQQYIIKNITSYFDGDDDAFPVTIKVYRMTNDRTSSKKATYIDMIKWYSFTEMKEVKLGYRNRAVVATELLAEDFGDNIPNRAWKIKGRKIKIPNNYTPSTRDYSGTWDGDFSTTLTYCVNPAWVVYDLLTNKRYGLGIDPDYIDKWTLYSIGQYCDGDITYDVDTRQSDGSYGRAEVTQPRFTFNGVISDREQALVVINHFCSVFRGFPMWSSGLVSFGQDAPADITRIATNANVKDGIFEYEGTSKRQRTTAVKVGWNDPDNFGKRETVVVEDTAGIVKYGYNPFDFFAIGCNNRNEAIMRGKYALYTNINQTEICNFGGGLEWADALPGDVIGIQDANYAGASWSGRIVSSTTTSITIDQSVTIVGGTTYTLYLQTATGNTTTKTLTNSAGATSTLTWSGAITAPTVGYVWAVSSTALAIRKFRIMSVKEVENNEFQIFSYEYDPNKYSLVEEGIVVEAPIPTTQPVGALTPPSNITAESYTYKDGDVGNRKYGMIIEWTASTDVRTQYYEVAYTYEGGGSKIEIDNTGDTIYDWKDIPAGTYDIFCRARNLTAHSKWITAVDVVVETTVSGIQPPTNLRIYGTVSGTEWTGKDCHIEWDAVDVAYYNGTTVTGVVSQYKIEVRKADTTLLRTYNTSSNLETDYIYTYEMNLEDNEGTPLRNLLFYAYSVDRYAETSATYDTLACSNPAPDMSSSLPVVTPKWNYLKVTWAAVNDNDMSHYKIYCDTEATPTTHVGTVSKDTLIFEIFGGSYGVTQYVQIEPFDLFGAGTKSQIPDGEFVLQIPPINVDAELQNSITITTVSGLSYSGTITQLYDGNFTASGITFTPSAGQYIQYYYSLENYFDRIGVWSANANPRIFVALSADGDTWSYLSGEADHTLDADGTLVSTTSGTAATNYWQLAAGFNIALFPDNLTAKYVRVHFQNTNSTQIYELVPSRILISELAAIGSLASISANIGTIVAGSLQSSDYDADSGSLFDLDEGILRLGGTTAPKFEYLESGQTLTLRSDDGKTVFVNNCWTITDEASVVRVKLGKLS